MEESIKVDYTVEELKAMLQEKEATTANKKQQERTNYETKRDLFVKRVISEALAYNDILKEFKNDLHKSFEDHAEKLAAYGGIRTNSKGGFSLTTADGQFRVKRIRQTTPDWDERSKKGEELIIAFLKEKIENKKIHKLVMSFLDKNEKGELEYSQVMKLLAMKNEFSDDNWIKGLELMQESYTISLRAYSYEFLTKDKHGKWNRLELNFSSI